MNLVSNIIFESETNDTIFDIESLKNGLLEYAMFS